MSANDFNVQQWIKEYGGNTPPARMLKEHSCGKVRYTEKRDAVTAANHLARNVTGRLQRPYHCSGCGGWHLTSQI